MFVLGMRQLSMGMVMLVMKVRMNIITMTGDWRMRNMVKFITLCHLAMWAMMAMMAMVTMVTTVTMMAMMMGDLSLLDNMLAICFITGEQKVCYCPF